MKSKKPIVSTINIPTAIPSGIKGLSGMTKLPFTNPTHDIISKPSYEEFVKEFHDEYDVYLFAAGISPDDIETILEKVYEHIYG